MAPARPTLPFSRNGGGSSLRKGVTVRRAAIAAVVVLLLLSPPSAAQAPEWALSDAPVVQIGVVDGAPEYQFQRAQAALRLSDGRIVAADANEIRYYDARGRHLRTVGGAGRGPGEFQFVNQLFRLPGDTVVAWDIPRRRRSWFDGAGAFVRTQQLTITAQDGWFMEGGWLLPGGKVLGELIQGGTEPQRRVRRPPTRYVVITPAGPTVALGTYGGFMQASGGSMGPAVQPYTPNTLATFSSDRIYIGDSARPQVDAFRMDGTRAGRIALNRQPVAVSRTQLSEYRERQREYEASARDRRARLESDVPMPEYLPYFAELVTDTQGNLWVMDYQPRPGGPSRWTVVSPQGRELGRVTLPERLRPLEIGPGYVLGVWRDELDVPYLRQYALTRR